MNPAANGKALVAVDLGAQSCRVSLLRWNHNEPKITLIHRFANGPIETARGLCWDMEGILEGIKTGLHLAAKEAPEGIASIGVDGWAVDYVRLRETGNPVADPFCYRDVRTEKAEKEVHAILLPARLYARTGIQILRINTLYQLFADKLAGMDPRLPWVNLPEFVSYRLGGKRVSEYTNATHTALVDIKTNGWCDEIFRETGLDLAAAPELVASGSVIGKVGGDLAELSEFQDTQVIVPACHDTASAIAAIPAVGDEWAFISSGTWSLVGTILDSPNISDDACTLNFTNLGGIGGKTYFLKNVPGMWLLQQCMDEWNRIGNGWSLGDLLSACEHLPAPGRYIDVDAPELMLPGGILGKINTQLERLGQGKVSAISSNIAFIANLIFHSLANRYAEVLSSIEKITNKRLKRVFIVGGGNQNALLNLLTSERSGLEVILGSTESTTIGNFAVQTAALQGDWCPSTGVSATAVAQWAERMMPRPLVPSSSPRTN